MKTLTTLVTLCLFGNIALGNNLRDEIELEKVKLRTYNEAMTLAEKEGKPIVVCVGCHADDVDLFNSLKGKVILCYLQASQHPFQTTNEGVVIGLWTTHGGKTMCQRHNVAANSFSEKILDSLTLSAVDCADGKCFTPTNNVFFGSSTYCPTCPQQRK